MKKFFSLKTYIFFTVKKHAPYIKWRKSVSWWTDCTACHYHSIIALLFTLYPEKIFTLKWESRGFIAMIFSNAWLNSISLHLLSIWSQQSLFYNFSLKTISLTQIFMTIYPPQTYFFIYFLWTHSNHFSCLLN